MVSVRYALKFSLLVLAFIQSNLANAETIDVSCIAVGKGWALESTANASYPIARSDAFAAAITNVEGQPCKNGVPLSCPNGLIDPLVRNDVLNCQGDVSMNCAGGITSTACIGQPNISGNGQCCIVACKLVKRCVVPGA